MATRVIVRHDCSACTPFSFMYSAIPHTSDPIVALPTEFLWAFRFFCDKTSILNAAVRVLSSRSDPILHSPLNRSFTSTRKYLSCTSTLGLLSNTTRCLAMVSVQAEWVHEMMLIADTLEVVLYQYPYSSGLLLVHSSTRQVLVLYASFTSFERVMRSGNPWQRSIFSIIRQTVRRSDALLRTLVQERTGPRFLILGLKKRFVFKSYLMRDSEYMKHMVQDSTGSVCTLIEPLTDY